MAVLISGVVSGCLGLGPAGEESGWGAGASADAAPPVEPKPHVVVALIDTGINVYHSEFRERAYGESEADPAVLIPGFPANESKKLYPAFSAGDYRRAVEADKEEWNSVQRGELVIFPGTKAMGISFSKTDLISQVFELEDDYTRILDTVGHGTMTASRAGGNTISLGGPEVRIVMVQASLNLFELESASEAVDWVAAQDWIDIVSCSWGLPVPTGPAAEAVTKWTESIRNLAAEKPAFFSAGNGFGNGVGTGYPSEFQDTLPADAISVGGHDNGRFVYWANWMPYLSGDVLRNPAARHMEMDKIENYGSGTSSAAPFTAGGAASLLLEARKMLDDVGSVRPGGVLAQAGPRAALPAKGPLSDGTLTLDEFKRLLFHTAVVPQEDPSDGDASRLSIPVPGQEALPATLYPFFGYGEVNNKSVEVAQRVIHGDADEPVRVVEDALYARDYELRKSLYG